ncbi:hypothetical protein D3C87_1808450 [compost metagenome]
MVDTLVAWPLTNEMASSTPYSAAISISSSRWMGRSPDTRRLAETEVPYRSMAALAAAATTGSPDMFR